MQAEESEYVREIEEISYVAWSVSDTTKTGYNWFASITKNIVDEKGQKLPITN